MENKNIKLSFTDSTTFTGIDAAGFYSAALLEATSSKTFQLIPNVKSKIKLGLLDGMNLIQDADCTFTEGGSGTLAQKAMEVLPYKVNGEYCKRTFETNYLSLQLRPGSNNPEAMPTSVEAYLLQRAAEHIANDIEIVTWQGAKTAGSTAYPKSIADGLLYKFGASGSGVNNLSGATTLSASNIIAKLGLVHDAIPQVVLTKSDLVIYASTAAVKFFKQAIAATYTGSYIGDVELNYLGIPIVWAPGLPANALVAACKSNLVFLTDLESDFEDVQVIPMAIVGVPTVRLVGEFKFGVDFIIGDEIVCYKA